MIVDNNSFLSKFKFISYFITRAFLLAVVLLFVLVGICFFIYYGDLYVNVKSGHYNNPLFNGYIIVSKSMFPTIKINDAIVVKRDNDDKYNIGDIISFFSTEYDSKGMVVTHRIISKNKKNMKTSIYKTKGDNNSIADKDTVVTEKIYGKVMFIIPKLGYIQSFFKNPINLVCCILLPSLFIIVFDFIRVGVLFKKNRRVT